MNSKPQINKYPEFIIDQYRMVSDKTVEFSYYFKDGPEFKESLTFPVKIDDKKLKGLIDLYALMASVSYYKAYPAPKIVSKIEYGSKVQELLNNLFTYGLGEFVYENKILFSDIAKFNDAKELLKSDKLNIERQGSLVALGGGKDSLVTVEEYLIRDKDFELFRVNSVELIEEQASIADLKLNKVDRQISKNLLKLNNEDALNGHVPITALVAVIGLILSFAKGFNSLVLSNENSANIANTDYDGLKINHQYSKSEPAIRLLNEAIEEFGYGENKIKNALSNLNEIEIAHLFSSLCLPKYSGAWNSSNQNFKLNNNQPSWWDWSSPKTLSVFALLAVFLDKKTLKNEFNIDDDFDPFTQESDTWLQLIGEQKFKPFECVADTEEMRTAVMNIDSKQWPAVLKYQNLIGDGFKKLKPLDTKNLSSMIN